MIMGGFQALKSAITGKYINTASLHNVKVWVKIADFMDMDNCTFK